MLRTARSEHSKPWWDSICRLNAPCAAGVENRSSCHRSPNLLTLPAVIISVPSLSKIYRVEVALSVGTAPRDGLEVKSSSSSSYGSFDR